MAPTRFLSVVAFIALVTLASFHRTADAITFTWVAGDGNWHVPQFWTPFAPPIQGPPGLGDAANILGDRNVTLTADAQGLSGLSLQALGDIFTNGHQLSVANIGGSATATVVGTGATGNNTEVFVEAAGGATPGFIVDNLDLLNGGELDLTAGGITHVTNLLSVDGLSTITGDGTIVFTNTHGVNSKRLDLHGKIKPDASDTIRLVVESGALDLDGAPGVTGVGFIDLTNDDSALEIEGALTDAFSGNIHMTTGTHLSVSEPWSMGANNTTTPLLEVTAGSDEAIVSGGELTVGATDANISVVTGLLRLQADTVFQSHANVDIAANGELQIGTGTTNALITGGTWTGAGAVNLDAGTTTIAANTTVNMPNGTFDLDGNTTGDTVSIDQTLLLNVASVDDNDSNQIDGTTRINGAAGQLNVHFTNPSQSYEFGGVLDLNGPAVGFAGVHLAGADVELSGTTTVSGNSISHARVDVSGDMDVAASGTFNFQGGSANNPNVIRSSASFSGSGDLVVSTGAQLNVEDGGIVDINVDNRGRFEPGLELGATLIDADYTQSNGAVLGFEIAGPPGGDQDFLHVTNTATVDGELEVAALAGFVPTPGDLYTVISTGNRLGTFDTLTTNGEGVVDFDGEIVYSAGLVQLSITDVSLDGDFNGDLGLDCADVDALVAEIAAGGGDLMFDLTGDGVVNTADLDQWLDGSGTFNVGGAYLHGDANLDGFVDGLDFVVWNDNKFTSTAAWCHADFNADGLTDGLDFIAWNANKFTASDATATVPEPSAGLLILLGIICSAQLRPGDGR